GRGAWRARGRRAEGPARRARRSAADGGTRARSRAATLDSLPCRCPSPGPPAGRADLAEPTEESSVPPAPPAEPTLAQVAAQLGVAPGTVRRWVQRGLVPGFDGRWTPS